MKISGVDHIAINVKDLKDSRIFYGEVLELPEGGFIDMGDHTLTYYRLSEDVRLELIDYKEKTKSKEVRETDTGTYRHFCLVTEDLQEVYDRCKENGVFVRKSPSYVEKLSACTMLITDPNGVEIEIIQR